MFYTDTRIDEAIGMLRTDINSNKRDISISKTWDIIARQMSNHPKTSSSVTLIPIPKTLV